MGFEDKPQFPKGGEPKIVPFSEFGKSSERFSHDAILEQARNHLISYHYAVKQLDGNPLPGSDDELDRVEGEKDNWLSLLSEDERAQVIESAEDWISIKEEMEE